MRYILILLVLLAGQSHAQLGQPLEKLLERLSDQSIIKTVLGYSTLNNFQLTFEERGEVLYQVSGEGVFDEATIAFGAELLGAATGYGQAISAPVVDFLTDRGTELLNQGAVNLAVEQFTWTVELSGEGNPYAFRMSLAFTEVDETLFPAARHSLGPADARHVIREFSDFQCPFCARFAFGPLEDIKADLLSRGDVRFEFHHFPLISIHANAVPAAEAAECVVAQNSPDDFWAYHDALFGQLTRWQGMAEPQAFFVELAVNIGLEADDMMRCLAEGDHTLTVMDAYEAAANLRLTGTPTVFVNGFRVMDFGNMQNYGELMELSEAFALD